MTTGRRHGDDMVMPSTRSGDMYEKSQNVYMSGCSGAYARPHVDRPRRSVPGSAASSSLDAGRDAGGAQGGHRRQSSPRRPGSSGPAPAGPDDARSPAPGSRGAGLERDRERRDHERRAVPRCRGHAGHQDVPGGQGGPALPPCPVGRVRLAADAPPDVRNSTRDLQRAAGPNRHSAQSTGDLYRQPRQP